MATIVWRLGKIDTRCRYTPGEMTTPGTLCEANKPLTECLTDLAKAARTSSWVRAYRDILTETSETYIDLEAYASGVRCYSNTWIPDLLQDQDYATGLIDAGGTLRAVEVRRHTMVRMNRQHLLARQPQPATFEFLLDEATLHRAPNHPAAVAQLTRLTELVGLANVSVRVVPHRACPYPGLAAGPFTILSFPDDQQLGHILTTVHAVHSGEPCLLTAAEAVDKYRQWWDGISDAALDEPTSLRLIAELRRVHVQ